MLKRECCPKQRDAVKSSGKRDQSVQSWVSNTRLQRVALEQQEQLEVRHGEDQMKSEL
jgi:uncharacterized protein YidB (DUF937 family)